MADGPEAEITRLLNRAAAGDNRAGNEVFPLLYAELRKLAASARAGLRRDQTLATTALVHEAYLRIAGRNADGWEGARHFYFTAVRAMRDILVEEARRKTSQKRGGGQADLSLDAAEWCYDSTPEDVLNLDAALRRLEGEDPDGHQLVVLRYYSGLSLPEIAELLETSLRTLERRWRFLRAWLARELESA